MKKGIWFAAATLIAAALVLTSCGQSTPGTTATTTTKPPGVLTNPKYGGTLTHALPSGWSSFDLMQGMDIGEVWVQLTHNEPVGGDWTKGPLGSGETNWNWGALGIPSLLNGEIAESWDVPDKTTIIWHLRKGVHFAKNPKAEKNSLVNGREMVADDWVWSMQQAYDNPMNWQARQYPPGDARRPTSFKALDKYTVEAKVPADSQALMLWEMGGNNHIKCPELWTTKGDNTKWQNNIGTGPFILNDYVDGSQATFVKNPDYWGTDPLHPKNKVPYVDKVQMLIIPDTATRLTAFRTARLDFMGVHPPSLMISSEDNKQLLAQYPKVRSKKRIMTQPVLTGRQDKAPFNDIKVRRALNLAVNQPEILKDYFKGDGELLAYPYPPEPDWSPYFTPMSQMPADVQELFTYNPEKAKQLLAEAGYPNGFKAEVVVSSTQPSPDEVSLLAGYLSKVGVTLQISVQEPVAYGRINNANDFKDMIYGAGGGIWAPYEQLNTKSPSSKTVVVDPYFVEVGKIIGRDWISNQPSYFKALKESGVKELQLANSIWLPVPYKYNVWWPWLGGFEGIGWTGWADVYDWYAFLWLDPDVKKASGF